MRSILLELACWLFRPAEIHPPSDWEIERVSLDGSFRLVEQCHHEHMDCRGGVVCIVPDCHHPTASGRVWCKAGQVGAQVGDGAGCVRARIDQDGMAWL